MRIAIYTIKYLIIKIIKRQSMGKFIANICEKMGVTYIKLAQILSTRSDIIKNKRSLEDLSNITDKCNELEFEKINEILKLEYGNELSTIFQNIEEKPIGYASISQVHKATLKNGDIVALKIKRKDVTKNVKKDIKMIRNGMKILRIFSKEIRYVANTSFLECYFKWILEETDLIHEKNNILKMNEYTKKLEEESEFINCKKMLPLKVYEEYSSKNILVMEYIPYKTINQLEKTKENEEKIEEAMNSYLQYYFHAIFNFEMIYYHGDPHMGNLYLDKEGNLGFLDFGLVFSFSNKEIEKIKEIGFHIYKQERELIFEDLMKLTKKYGYLLKERKKEEKLKKEIEIFLNKTQDITITNWFIEMAMICIRNDLYVPEFFYEFAKALVIVDGITISAKNKETAETLLFKQFEEYYEKEVVNQVIEQGLKGLKQGKKVLEISVERLIEKIPDIIEILAKK